MRKVSVIFCTYPSIYSDLVLERLLNASHIQVVAIIESTRVLKKQGYVLIDSIKLLKKVESLIQYIKSEKLRKEL